MKGEGQHDLPSTAKPHKRHMKNLVLIFGLLFLFSCTEEVVKKPEDLIPEEQMVDIYFDISLINAARNSGYDKFKEHGIDSRDYLYKKFGIDSVRLGRSAEYYTSVPLVNERIYTRVEEKLDSLKALMDEEMSREQKARSMESNVADSLQVETVTDSLAKENAADSLQLETVTDSLAIEKAADSLKSESDSLETDIPSDSLEVANTPTDRP